VIHEFADLLVRGDIAGKRAGAAAPGTDFGRDPFDSVQRHVGEKASCAARSCKLCCCLADAACGTGDDNNLVRQIHSASSTNRSRGLASIGMDEARSRRFPN
jgi:hypothetical protein